nr:integrase, catalytic region, zinc finger, CCHC-type, peptidase aspartic, catalytic [Tanacetum cinerariifolium]
MVFMAQIEKVLSDSKASSSSADDNISEVSFYLSESESESEYETSEYYDNTTTYDLFVNDNDDQEIFHDCEIFLKNLIESQINHNESAVDHNNSEGVDKLIRKFNKKIVTARENKIEFAYDYGNLNASYVNEKINFSDDYFQEIINPDFEKIDSPFQQTSSLKPYVPTVILEKIIIYLEDEVVSLLEKEKEILKTIESLKSNDVETAVQSSEKVISETKNKSENDCQDIEKVCNRKENPNVITPGMFKISVSQSVSPISVTKTYCASNGVENLDTISRVRRPKHSGVIWKQKRSYNTSMLIYLFVFDYNNARNALCNARMNASVDVNDLFVFYDVSIRKSHVSKMLFRKKPRDSLNIVQICLWIIDSGCSKHMTGNRALLTNFVEKFFGTVRFSNNDFAVIAGYGDVVIGSMTI